ncbi:MAG: hypothetical protein LCH43_07770 [Actinobacteria bacterium]|nr:hypothetical protein [Actinomycetota bacterium]
MKRQRLAAYDLKARRLSTGAGVVGLIPWLAAAVLLPTMVTIGWQGIPVDHTPQLAAVAISSAATLGGLTTTIFFLTAQLRVVGIAQHGITEIYRVSRYLPIVISTMIAVVAGLVALASKTCDPTVAVDCPAWTFPVLWGGQPILHDPSRLAAGCAATAVVFLALTALALGLTLLSNLDPVTVARRFARKIRPHDAVEWGLISFRFREPASKEDPIHSFSINSNRKNFGLRDPLMPIHEMLLQANHQRFGQLIGVLLERVAEEYRMTWIAQSADPRQWKPGRARLWAWWIAPATKARPGSRDTSLPLVEQRISRDRLALAGLMIHYVRRIPRSTETSTKGLDVQRQAAQHQLAWFITSLAGVPQRDSPGRYRPSRADLTDAIDLALNAIAHISRDFKAIPPYGASESLWALAAAARVLAQAGLPVQAESAVDLLIWCKHHTLHMGSERQAEVFANLAMKDASGTDNNELIVRFKEGIERPNLPRSLPKTGKSDPWLDDGRPVLSPPELPPQVGWDGTVQDPARLEPVAEPARGRRRR